MLWRPVFNCPQRGELILAIFSWCVLIALPTTTMASPPDLFGMGPRSSSMGHTGVSYDGSFAAAWLNPAGLGIDKTSEINIGLGAAEYDLRLNDMPAEPPSSQQLIMGLRLPLPFGGPLKDMLSFGLAVSLPNGTLLKTASEYVDNPQWTVLSRADSIAVAIALGVDLSRWVPGLRIGGGVQAIGSLIGDLEVFLTANNAFSSRTETQLIAQFGALVGAQYELEDFTFGLTYRQEYMSVISLGVEFEPIGSLELPRFDLEAVVQYDPHTFALEAAWQPCDRWLVAAGATYRMWSRYPGAVTQTTAASPVPPRSEFSDTISPRVGLEHRLPTKRGFISLRAGYLFELTPAPGAAALNVVTPDGQVLETEFVSRRNIDNDRHIVTLGLGAQTDFGRNLTWNFDIYGQAHFLASRTHAIGIVDSDPEPMTSGGIVWNLGFNARLSWY